MRVIKLLFILLALSSGIQAASGLRFMAIEPGARPVGMGGAFTSITADPYSAAYNPAAVYGVDRLAGSLGTNTYWVNTNVHSGYLIFKKRGLAFNVGIRYGEVSDIQARPDDPVEDPLYTFAEHEVSFKAGLAVKPASMVALGFSAGWMIQKLDTYRGHAVNYDLGILVTPLTGLNIGASILNMGQQMKINTAEYDLPTFYRFGVSYAWGKFLPALDIVSNDAQGHIHLGGEYQVADILFLRGGYRTNYDTNDFSLGVGFSKRNFRVDYAFMPYSSGHDDAHIFNLTFGL